MKQHIQLRIPEPCHENWANMTATQQGRFCMSCQKEVVDFSVMTDKEILNYISTAAKNICGRVANDQLNRNLIAPREPHKIWWRYWMGVAASFVLLSSRSYAQGTVSKQSAVCKPSASKKDKPVVLRLGGMAATVISSNIKMQILGRVIDNNRNPVPYASIRMKEGSTGVSADSAGVFMLNTTVDVSDIELSISSVGYEQKTIRVNTIENAKPVTTMNGIATKDIGDVLLAVPAMNTVLVTANRLQGLTGFAGGISVCRRVSRFEKAKNKFKEVLAINEIKVFPNPITANSVFNIRFSLKNEGEYQVQFTDVSGKIITTRQLNIFSKNQLESFNSNMFRSSGIYFVSLSSKQNPTIYTTKLLVQ